MRAIGQLIEDVNSSYSKGASSDDFRLAPRLTYSFLLKVRSRLLTQQFNKNQKIGQASYQTLNCVELEKAPMHECPCLPPVGCTIYRTKHILPEPLVGMDNHLIESVSSVTGEVMFSETSWEEKKYAGGRRYVKRKNDFYIRNQRIYITMQTGPSMISITGLWQDPVVAYNYPSACKCETGDCDDCVSPLDKGFPIDSHLVDPLIEMTYQQIARSFGRSLEDKDTNTSDDTFSQPTQQEN